MTEVETYRQMHETTTELGYPSILEALEHLSELKARSTPSVDEEMLEALDWRPIEMAPKDGSYIIAGRFGKSRDLQWVQEARWITAAEAAEEDGCPSEEDAYHPGWSHDGDRCHPTHFMPLRAPSIARAESAQA